MLKPALRPPMRAPLRSADSPREGVGGVIGSLSALKTKMQAGSAATVLTIGEHVCAVDADPPVIAVVIIVK